MIYALAIFADMTRYFSQYSLSVARVRCTGNPTAATLKMSTNLALNVGHGMVDIASPPVPPK